MQFIQARISEFRPLILISYLASAALLNVLAVQHYLDLPMNIWAGVILTIIVFSIYTLNRFTDLREDFANDVSKAVFFDKWKVLFKISLFGLAAAFAWLVVIGKLNLFYVSILFLGFLYSYKLIPWYDGREGWHYVRLKDILFMKNFSVSAIWAFSVFMVPLIHAPKAVHGSIDFMALGVLFFIMVFINTVFCDYRDIKGDAAAGVKTLPVAMGYRGSYAVLGCLSIIWMSLIVWLFIAGSLNARHLGFHIFICLAYPIAYGLAFHKRILPQPILDFVNESIFLIFAAGVVYLCL